MIRDDFLLRQIRTLVQFVARALGRRAPSEEVEVAVAAVAGLDLDVAEQLPPGTLLTLLTTAEGLDAERCLALGIGLAARARGARDQGESAREARLTSAAGALVAAALAARPTLDEPALHALLAELGVDE